MSKRIKEVIALLIFVLIIIILSITTHAKGLRQIKDLETPFVMQTTGYCTGHTTCTGQPVREGFCAVRKDWVSKTALIYECKADGTIGDLLCILECEDTGFGADSDGDGLGSIEEGYVIDVYFETLDKVYEWMELTNGRVYVQLIDAVG